VRLSMADVKIGEVTHYYNKIGVGVIKLSKGLSVDDQIKIKNKQGEFIQAVSSMQMEHENVKKAKRGQIIGLKVDQEVKKGDQVFKV